jgi:hypothetical protein
MELSFERPIAVDAIFERIARHFPDARGRMLKLISLPSDPSSDSSSVDMTHFDRGLYAGCRNPAYLSESFVSFVFFVVKLLHVLLIKDNSSTT